MNTTLYYTTKSRSKQLITTTYLAETFLYLHMAPIYYEFHKVSQLQNRYLLFEFLDSSDSVTIPVPSTADLKQVKDKISIKPCTELAYIMIGVMRGLLRNMQPLAVSDGDE
jgi:hypothetical protein